MLEVQKQKRYTYLYHEAYSFHAFPQVAIAHYGQTLTTPTLLQYYDYFIEQQKKLIGNGKESDTIRTYGIRLKKLVEYLTDCDTMDVRPQDITIQWIREFETWMRSKGLSINYISKILQLLNTQLITARENGEVTNNPFDLYKFRYNRNLEHSVLEATDLKKLMNHQFRQNSLRKVADGFVFSCLTGLAYVDVRNFSKENHTEIGPDGKTWIIFKRIKSGQETVVPLFKEAEEILKKYGDRLPIPSNQLMNKYIKECFEIAGIEKYVTTHTARRSFAHIMHNEYGIPIDSISKMLGHNSIRTTQQYYVRTLINKIIIDLKGKDKFFERVA